MTIVLTAGGSGGHITPILAVAAELKKRDPKLRLIYIGQRGDSLGDIPARDSNIDASYVVRAGKFRRYHGESLLQFLNPATLYKNTRDFFFVLIGIWQSVRLMKKLRPDVIFSRGGFVSVPVALGGMIRGVPYITHDSDSIPSLANRIIARWASWHAVALPKELYPYPRAKTVTTGIPISDKFVPVSDVLKKQYRSKINVPVNAKLMFIIGGGLGSQIVNTAVAEAVPHLLHEYPDLYVVHQVGRSKQAETDSSYGSKLTETDQKRVQTLDYIEDVYNYSGAADVVITRAGATSLAEFAVQGKACIIIPSPFLVGGHQLENARYLEEQGAAVVINETDLQADPLRLAKQTSDLFKDQAKRIKLGQSLAKFAKPGATEELASLILSLGSSNK